MATVYSAQRTNTRANPTVKNKANELGGRVRIAHGTYEASSLASGDVIELFVLPDGAVGRLRRPHQRGWHRCLGFGCGLPGCHLDLVGC